MAKDILIQQTQGTKKCFTNKTFEFLAQLYNKPIKDTYNTYKQEFKEYLITPFQNLVREVAQITNQDIKEKMETKKRIFSSILKNDYGQGNAWDYYWSAFYPKNGKRTQDAQLFTWINHERLEFGFYIGDFGNKRKKLFIENCHDNQQLVLDLLSQNFGNQEIVLGSREQVRVALGGLIIHNNPEINSWLNNLQESDISVAIILPKSEVIQYSCDELSNLIAEVFEKMFPLVIMATEEEPALTIKQYLNNYLVSNRDGNVFKVINYIYSIEDIVNITRLSLDSIQYYLETLKRKKQIILQGSPGTGKTFIAENIAKYLIGGTDGFYDIIQFHPGYTYEDFIQGIRPQTNNGQLEYNLVPGRFLEFCHKAEACNDNCILIIDEINRANLSSVFGELMYLLEYRDREIYLAGSQDKFRIPNNVYIIGTMNTADRSIALVDFALRRRFAFITVKPNYEIIRKFHKDNKQIQIESLITILKNITQEINDSNYSLGISYFLIEDLASEIENIWRMEIEPYLEEYFYNSIEEIDQFRWDKVKDNILT